MKENKLLIQIHKPVNEVFEFLLNPTNTPRWIEDIKVEGTSEWPIKLGTIYRNRNVTNEWSEYIVSALEQNKFFEFTEKDDNYHVRYTFTELEDGITAVEYFEWVKEGDLDNPFTDNILQKLKSLIEADSTK